MARKRKAWWTIYRSAITGQFVSKAYAALHPDTTVSHVIRPQETSDNEGENHADQ